MTTDRLRKWRARALKSLLVVAVIVGFGLAVAQDQETLRLESAFPAADARFPEYIAALTGTAVTGGDRYRMLVNGDQIFPAMLEAIGQARQRIAFESYIYSEGRVAERFTTALADAARRGVAVKTVVDAVGASDMTDAAKRTLESAGVRLQWFNPIRFHTLEEVNYRTHRKILVVDGRVGFTGGAGVSDHWLGNARRPEEWRDTHVAIEGPVLRYLEAGFYENWIETGGTTAPAIDMASDVPPGPAATRSLVVWSSPTGGASRLKLLYLLLFAGARRSIDVQSPYFITDESTLRAIQRARARGVRVRFLVEGDRTDARSVKFASRAIYDDLLARGIEIHEYTPTMMHAKAIIVDDVWTVFGSANFDNRSLELNDELNLAVRDPDLAFQFTSQYDRDLARSHKLELGEWRARPWLDKVRENFWDFFSEVF